MANSYNISLAPDVAAVKVVVDTILVDTDVTIPADITAHKVATDASGVITANIHDTDLPLVKTDTAAILVDTDVTIPADIAAHKVATDASGVITANIHDTDLPLVKTDTGDIRTDVTAIHDTDLPLVKTDTAAILDDTDATIPAQITAHKVATDASGVITANIHDTDLPLVKTDTGNIRTVDVPAVQASITAHKVATDASGVITANIHDTDLPLVKTDTNNLRTVDFPATDATITTLDTLIDWIKVQCDEMRITEIPAVKTVVDANAVILGDIHNTDLPAVKAETVLIVADTNELQLEKQKRNTPLVASDDCVSLDTYEDIVNISDKGIMFGISSTLGACASFGSIKIIIDAGTIIERLHFVEPDTNDRGHASLSCWLPFETSLQVQHKKAIAGGNIYSTVSYTTD